MSTHSKLKGWSLLPRVLVILMAFSEGRAFAEQVTAFAPAPAAGTGTSQLFTFHASDSSGYASIPSLNVIINSSLNAVNACYFDYNRDANWIGLANDGATTFGTGGTLGSSTVLPNSQCSINLAQSSVTGSGNDLYLTVAITFTQSFFGSKGVYEEVFNSAGQNGGWFWVGTWTVGTSLLAPDSIFPPSGTGGTQTFTFTGSSPGGPGYSGYNYIDDVFVQFN